MSRHRICRLCFLVWLVGGFLSPVAGQNAENDLQILPNAQPLTVQGDLSAQMVAGIDRFLLHQIDLATNNRPSLWTRDFSSAEAYENSIQKNRQHLRKIIGAVDPRLQLTELEWIGGSSTPEKVAETDTFTIRAVRWPVFDGVYGEGLWLEPKSAPRARIIALPDADQTPEIIVGLTPGVPPERHWARRMAENGCSVLVMTLIDRQDMFSGNAALHKFTNQPHREWIYRQAFEMGRHIIGYEVQKVSAAVDFFQSLNARSSGPKLKIAVAGYSEGGLIALYAAAVDNRIDGALVSGYFDNRQKVWQEPIYRNVFGLLEEFGDAELATLIAPRALIVEHASIPKLDGPPKPREGRTGAAPGVLKTADYESVEAELERARALLAKSTGFGHFEMISGAEGMATGPCGDRAIVYLLKSLGISIEQLKPAGAVPVDARKSFAPEPRQQRQVKELEEYTQRMLSDSERVRTDFLWSKLKAGSTQDWTTASAAYKSNLWENVIGRLPSPSLPPNAHTRKISLPAGAKTNLVTAYEVTLDVFPDIFAWAYLLVPENLKPGERRPVVVCQHGLEGTPADTVNEDGKSTAHGYYKAFSTRLAEQGFVVLAPHNPYRGEDKFRQLQRKANPIRKSLFSVIIAQHDQYLNWLESLPFVDAKRIGFYGLSYGGKTAMRVPAVLDRYALSICSADFNDWVRKNVTVESPLSYMFLREYELPEYDLGHTFNYAEMAALIAPRPFMVERGHSDGVAIDEWVAYEYAKVRRLYDQLGIGDRTEIEFFNGPHTINGQKTFDFLHQHLNLPK